MVTSDTASTLPLGTAAGPINTSAGVSATSVGSNTAGSSSTVGSSSLTSANAGAALVPNAFIAQPANCFLVNRVPPEIRNLIFAYLLTDPTLAENTPFHPIQASRKIGDISDSSTVSPETVGSIEPKDSEETPPQVQKASNTVHVDVAGQSLLVNGNTINSTPFDETPNSDDVHGDIRGTVLVGAPPPPRFDLSPEILLTCRQIYQEASAVLYNTNTFVLGIYADRVGQTPLLKGKNPDWRLPKVYNAGTIPAFKRIKNWRLVVGTSTYVKYSRKPMGLKNFCHALCESEARSLVVSVVREKVEISRQEVYIQHKNLMKALQPLDFLRNLTRLDLQEVNTDYVHILDLPDVLRIGAKWPGKLGTLQRVSVLSVEEKMELEELVKGNTPVETLFRAYKNLVLYARTFESNENYKFWMAKQVQAVSGIDGTENLSYVNERPSLLTQPLEQGLRRAAIACRENDVDKFRDARKLVVDLLETQYNYMFSATQQMAWYNHSLKAMAWKTKTQKSVYCRDTCLKAHAYIKQWVLCFERERLTGSIDDYSEEEYSFGPEMDRASQRREKYLTRLNKMNDGFDKMDNYGTGQCKRYFGVFRKLCSHMNDQYLEVHRVRVALYENDDFADENSKTLISGKKDMPIDWVIQRPHTDPLEFLGEDGNKVTEDPGNCRPSDDVDDYSYGGFRGRCSIIPAGHSYWQKRRNHFIRRNRR